LTLKESKGYLVVASKNSNFYSLAINCIESLRDYYPEAKVCLVTEERFLDGREYVADDLIFCGSNKREKLWGMSQSPYDLTMYIDADCEIEHEDIKNVFDEIDDNDMVFHELDVRGKGYFAIYNFMVDNVKESYKWCGGVCLYRNKEFMKDWYELFLKQESGEWTPNMRPWDKLKGFDQTTLWWLLNKCEKYDTIKVGNFKDNLRWNYYMTYDNSNLKPENPIIIKHYSNIAEKVKPYA